MQALELKLIDFYDAVIADDGMKVQEILNDNHKPSLPSLTVKMITGMLVIAIEQGLTSAGQAILFYNNYAKDKIEDKHLNSIMRFANNDNQAMSITLN